MDKTILKVKPVIIYPTCISVGERQDCFNCEIKYECISPRSICIKPYHNHPNGCPNFGKKDGCPPNTPMFDQVFDCDDIYAIVTEFDLGSHYDKMKLLHPNWTHYQLINSRYWQGKDRKCHKEALEEFCNLYDYVVTNWAESMGVDLIETLKKVNMTLKFPVEDTVKRVSLAGKILDGALDKYELSICTSDSGLKTLKKNKHC